MRPPPGDAARPMSPTPPPTPSDRAGPTTYVIGHRNPDADAICSAIAYAEYKRATGHAGYVAARCGNS
ncbi:MAG: hypothetical protein ACK5VI_02380, partial [Opitutia bacterium]